MTYLQNKYFTVNSPGLDAGGRVRSGTLTTLGDYKQLTTQDNLLLDVAGTGTQTYANNTLELSVTAGQYLVLQSKQYHNYFSGKSQQIEITGLNMEQEEGLVKTFGYYSTTTTAPYDLNHDGFFLQQDSAGLHLKVFNAGTLVASIPFTEWDGYTELQDYDWSKFTVSMFDFLWLGGAVLRLFIKTDKGFVHAHSYTFANGGQMFGGTNSTFTKYPNQPLRMEIRSTTGVGKITYVCGQVSTEGSLASGGKTVGVKSGNTRSTLLTIGTSYVMGAIRKRSGDYRYNTAKLEDIYTNITSADSAILEIQINPTISGGGVWADVPNTPIQALPPGGTVTSPGHVMLSVPISNTTAINAGVLVDNFLTRLGVTVAGVSTELHIVVIPVTTNVSILSSMIVRYDGE